MIKAGHGETDYETERPLSLTQRVSYLEQQLESTVPEEPDASITPSAGTLPLNWGIASPDLQFLKSEVQSSGG